MVFKPYSKPVYHDYNCEMCGRPFSSFLSPEFFERKGWAKTCGLCSMYGHYDEE